MDIALCLSNHHHQRYEIRSMGISHRRVRTYRANRVFKFSPRATRRPGATVTAPAQNLDVTWNRIYALFHGSNLSNTDLPRPLSDTMKRLVNESASGGQSHFQAA